MSFKIVGAGPNSQVPFEVKVASAAEAQAALGEARQVCPGVTVLGAAGQPIDDAELALLAELEAVLSRVG